MTQKSSLVKRTGFHLLGRTFIAIAGWWTRLDAPTTHSHWHSLWAGSANCYGWHCSLGAAANAGYPQTRWKQGCAWPIMRLKREMIAKCTDDKNLSSCWSLKSEQCMKSSLKTMILSAISDILFKMKSWNEDNFQFFFLTFLKILDF